MKKRFNDILEVCKHEILYIGIENFVTKVLLSGHGRIKHESNKGIHKKSDRGSD